MRVFDGSNSSPRRRQGDNSEYVNRNSSGSDSASSSSDGDGRSALSDSTSLSNTSGNLRTRNRARTRKRGRGQRDYNKLAGSNSVPIPNGVILTNGGGGGRERLINGLIPTRSASESPRTGRGTRHRKDAKILKRGKKFPPSTPTPNIFNYTQNTANQDLSSFSPSPQSKPKEDRQRSQNPSRALTLEDMELVDYDDLESSSSSLTSHFENEVLDKKTKNFQPQTPQPSKPILTLLPERSVKNSSKPDFTKLSDGAIANFGARKDSQISNTLSIDPDYENVPCSSSSLRERLSSQRSHRNPNPSSRASVELDHTMNTLFEDTFIEGTTSKSEKEKRFSVLSNKSESVSRLGLDNEALLSSDKYTNSGVGRHYGKKRSNSNISLGDSLPGDGEGDDSLGAELLAYLMRLKAVTIVFLGTLLVLSVSSLLFVFPIVVDPILLGLEAQFSRDPVNCRWVKVGRH